MQRKFKNLSVGIFLLALSSTAYASDVQPAIALPTIASSYTSNTKVYLLALNDADAPAKQIIAAPVIEPVEFKPRFFTMSKVHQYLGLGTVLFMGLTVLAAPDDGCEANCAPRQTFGTTHTRLARTAAKLALATVATGLIAHWDDFHLEDGFADPDNMHVMLAATGTALMLYAVHKSATSSTPTSHAGMAELGGAAMLVAIKLTW